MDGILGFEEGRDRSKREILGRYRSYRIIRVMGFFVGVRGF